jgi:hypothetical protein
VGNALSYWLRVREQADTAARSESLTQALADATAIRTSGAPLRLLDLGTGTGANIRYLIERLAGPQRWLVVDRNADLLTELPERMAAWAADSGYEARIDGRHCRVRGPRFDCTVETQQQDLGVLDDHALFAGRHVVTASALLDLVSEAWLLSLSAHCRAEKALAMFVITYNGRFSCTPTDPGDEEARILLNRHQTRDKGLGGPAAGPDAAGVAERCFLQAGYRVRRERSDWQLGPDDRDVQRLLIQGWAEASAEMAPARVVEIARWRAGRLAHLEAGRSHVMVGHDDLLAWPADTGSAGQP